MRNLLDKFLQAGIRLLMLTGVAFTVTASYGPPPEHLYGAEPEYQADQQKLEQQLTQTDNSINHQ